MNRLYYILILILCIFGCGPEEPTGPQLDPGYSESEQNWEPIFEEVPEKSACSDNKKAEILENSTDATVLNCNLDLEPGENISKRLIFTRGSSGAVLDCHNNNIRNINIHSPQIDGEFLPPHDITIQNCNINGNIRLWGMGVNGDDIDGLRASSRTEYHTTNVRNAAPYNITFDNVTINSDGIAIYFAPGTHHCILNDSLIFANSTSVAIYLDAETYGNELIDNYIDASNIWREAIALDGSSYNELTRNHIINAAYGGIYFYRNCGLNGVIRHATPSYNVLEENEIRCDCNIISAARDSCVGIFLGSRDGDKGYCDEDSGYPYGSSISDQDHARFNELIGNELFGCEIESGNRTNYDNVIQ